MHTPGKPARIKLVEVNIDSSKIKFQVKGPAKIISPIETNAEAGIATILLQAGTHAGFIKVITTSEGLQSGVIKIKSRN